MKAELILFVLVPNIIYLKFFSFLFLVQVLFVVIHLASKQNHLSLLKLDLVLKTELPKKTKSTVWKHKLITLLSLFVFIFFIYIYTIQTFVYNNLGHLALNKRTLVPTLSEDDWLRPQHGLMAEKRTKISEVCQD